MTVMSRHDHPGLHDLIMESLDYPKREYDRMGRLAEEVINDFCLQLETCGIKPLTLELKP